ncbi:alpha carbonic anhydrase 7-like [Chenopodium quinoa]|uniref:alpha carbonic anhydrase 7-like n=1 Tax=Chenopodium quinoa TaxID=63459 RepID=UPI000B773B61|nr:alpha carbonic anhydrase 7-like [Chenopodium quinoa]
MKKSTVLKFFLVLLLSHATSIIAQEVEDESEFNYIPGDKRGPENWGNIKEEWAKCNTGKKQSPIFIYPQLPERIPESERILRFYQPGRTTLKNRGHDVKLDWTNGGGRIRINGTDYILQQCHWHSPSEHAINGRRYALEAHFVHQSLDNKIAVIGFLYDFGNPDPFLSSIEEELSLISDNSLDEIMAGTVHPSEVQMEGSSYYRYMGSLTTPPCDEGIIWTIETKLGTVSKDQVKLLRDAVNDNARENARPLQPLNGRRVRLFDARLRVDDNKTLRTPYAASM